MKKKKSFWENMFSGANGGISSKRVLGSFILLVLLIVIVIKSFMDTDSTWFGEAFITMLVGAFSLLGIGVFENRIGNKSKSNHSSYKKNDYTQEEDTEEEQYESTDEESNNEEDNCT